jgi:protein involved in sex pheromone biosynthesis
MALEQSDFAQLGQFISQAVATELDKREAEKPAAPPVEPPKVDDANRIDDEAPTYYVHLANGEVLESKDSGSTHMDVNGVSVLVIGRYPMGA